MTATIDLIVLEENRTWEREDVLYELKWLITNYTDTSARNLDKDVSEQRANIRLIDALFGSGPEKYGLTSCKQVVLCDERYRPRKKVRELHNFSDKNTSEVHLALRSKFLEKVRGEYCRNINFFKGIELVELLELIDSLARTSHREFPEAVRAVNNFLLGLDLDSHLVIPLVGIGVDSLPPLDRMRHSWLPSMLTSSVLEYV